LNSTVVKVAVETAASLALVLSRMWPSDHIAPADHLFFLVRSCQVL
jgi:hypothetical protein